MTERVYRAILASSAVLHGVAAVGLVAWAAWLAVVAVRWLIGAVAWW